MLRQKFIFNDGSKPELDVIDVKSYKYEDGSAIQISKVLDMSNILIKDSFAYVPFKYVYEEIDEYDFITYARYMGVENINRNYPWARKLLS